MSDAQVVSQVERGKFVKTLESIYWGVVLLWAGLVFGADSLGYLPQIGEADAWSWAFAGAGLFGLIGALLRAISPNVLNPTAWDYIWSGGLSILGLAGFVGLEIGGALILIMAGGVLLVTTIFRRE